MSRQVTTARGPEPNVKRPGNGPDSAAFSANEDPPWITMSVTRDSRLAVGRERLEA
jgi:hypothetical protein